MLTTISSCRKNAEEIQLLDKQQIQKAKEWYESQHKNQVTKLAISDGRESELLFTPNWDKAKVVEIDGIISISTEIKTNFESKFKMDRYYSLVVKNDGNNFDSRVLYIDSREQASDEDMLSPIQLYEAAFTIATF